GAHHRVGSGARPPPLGHLGALRVPRIRQGRAELLVAVCAADVLGRAGTGAGQAHRVALRRVGRDDLLDRDLVLPPVAEVVDVAEPVVLADHGVEAGLPRIPYVQDGRRGRVAVLPPPPIAPAPLA